MTEDVREKHSKTEQPVKGKKGKMVKKTVVNVNEVTPIENEGGGLQTWRSPSLREGRKEDKRGG